MIEERDVSRERDRPSPWLPAALSQSFAAHPRMTENDTAIESLIILEREREREREIDRQLEREFDPGGNTI